MASIFDRQLMSKSDLQRIEELEKAWRSTDDKNLRAQGFIIARRVYAAATVTAAARTAVNITQSMTVCPSRRTLRVHMRAR